MGFLTDEFPGTSYYRSDLRKVLNAIKELGNTVDSYSEQIEEINAAIKIVNGMDKRVSALESATSDLEKIRGDIKTLEVNVEKLANKVVKLNMVYAYIDEQISVVTMKLDAYRNSILATVYMLDFETNAMLDTLRRKVEDMYDELIGRIEEIIPTTVFNEVSGIELGLNDNNFRVYQDLRYLGFTNTDLSEFGISNNEVASRCLNNRDYALFARKRFKVDYVFSPVTGVKTSIGNCLSDIISIFGGGDDNVTVDDYLRGIGVTNETIGQYITHNFNRYFYNV